MNNINDRIYAVKASMKERDRIKVLIKNCEVQRTELEVKRDMLLGDLQREEMDVKRLQGITLTSLIHLIKGDKEDILSMEEREVLSAKLKYDEACSDIDKISREIESLSQKLGEFRSLDSEYTSLVAEKEAYIKNEVPETKKKLDELMEEKIHSEARQKEIGEAIEAGQKLLDSLSEVQASLESASNWGTFDMLGGGLLATMAKHDKIDEARYKVNGAQSSLRKFHRELSDLGESIDIDLEIDSFLSFADYFFDGFFVDWAVQSKIEGALNKTDYTISAVKRLVLDLKKNLTIITKTLEELEEKRIRMIEEV
jgi:hypothetical protein